MALFPGSPAPGPRGPGGRVPGPPAPGREGSGWSAPGREGSGWSAPGGRAGSGSAPEGRAAYEPAPLTAEEKARAEVAFVPYVAGMLSTRGRFRTSAGRPEMVELFQRVARRAGQQLGRPVVSVSNGREITITFGIESAGVEGAGAEGAGVEGNRAVGAGAGGGPEVRPLE
jgi:hypothetical protein